jgi:hypothetical protein
MAASPNAWLARAKTALSHGLMHRAAKPALLALGLSPALWLLARGLMDALGANPVELLIRGLGEWSLRWLWLCLAITPLREATGLVALARFRRMLGLLAAGYASLHLVAYAGLELGLDWAELWHDTPAGYQVHDFTAWNRSRSEVEAQREKWRGKKRGSTVDSKGEPQGNHRGAKKLPRTDTIRDDTKREEEKSPAPAARLSQAELHEQSPREQLFEHWRDVAAAHGVLEPLTRTPKECHQAATLLDVHALDALRGAVTAFWDSASFDGKRSFGMFANQAPQLVAHVRAGKPYAFGAAPRVAEKAERAAKLEAWTPPVPRSAVAR